MGFINKLNEEINNIKLNESTGYEIDRNVYNEIISDNKGKDFIEVDGEIEDLIPNFFSMVDEIFDRLDADFFDNYVIEIKGGQPLVSIGFGYDGGDGGTVYADVDLNTNKVTDWYWDR